MELYDITQLKKDNDDFYDLTQPTFKFDDINIQYTPYTVQKGEEMRIDLVSDSIYGKTDYVDILLNVNNIDNPLNIKEGTVLFYPSEADIFNLRYTKSEQSEAIQAIANSQKSNRKDSNREKYINNKQSLPPTILPNQLDPVNIENGNFIIGDGLFNK